MQIFLWIIFTLICVIFLLKVFSTLISLFYGSPSGETNTKLADKVFQEINLKKKDMLVDLGSGLGNILLLAAKKYKTQAAGYEISPLPFLISKVRTINYKNIKIFHTNIFNADLSKATAVFCYLLPKLLDKLSMKLQSECQKKTIIISPIFQIKGLKLDRKILINNKIIYIYKI